MMETNSNHDKDRTDVSETPYEEQSGIPGFLQFFIDNFNEYKRETDAERGSDFGREGPYGETRVEPEEVSVNNIVTDTNGDATQISTEEVGSPDVVSESGDSAPQSEQDTITQVINLLGDFKSSYENLENEKQELSNKYNSALSQVEMLKADVARAKKRAAEERETMRDEVTAQIILKFLPLIDDFERSTWLGDSVDVQAVVEGNKGIYQRWITSLSALGITQYDPTGKIFDPISCVAIGADDNPDLEPNLVVRCVQVGYLQGDKVIRQASVVVSQ